MPIRFKNQEEVIKNVSMILPHRGRGYFLIKERTHEWFSTAREIYEHCCKHGYKHSWRILDVAEEHRKDPPKREPQQCVTYS